MYLLHLLKNLHTYIVKQGPEAPKWAQKAQTNSKRDPAKVKNHADESCMFSGACLSPCGFQIGFVQVLGPILDFAGMNGILEQREELKDLLIHLDF